MHTLPEISAWCEVDTDRLARNVRYFKNCVGPNVVLSVAVKANGYGHGLIAAGRAFVDGGADWLCVHTIQEAEELRAAQITVPIHIVGPVPISQLCRLSALNASMVVYNDSTVDELIRLDQSVRLHLKVETGNHRQGVGLDDCLALGKKIVDSKTLELEGICTHFSDIEDTTDHKFARYQMQRFEDVVGALAAHGINIPIRHVANTAATLLWDDLPYEMVRVGIGAYGLWPSKETQIAALLAKKEAPNLAPALTWKTWVAQVKQVPEGAYIGYGRTYKTTHPVKLAVLPAGYADGYDRKASNRGFVLCRGRRAPVVGRVCMNMIMIDITHISGVVVGDEVVLLGKQGSETISAEDLAAWTSTINYEVISRIGVHVPRFVVPGIENISPKEPYRVPSNSKRQHH